MSWTTLISPNELRAHLEDPDWVVVDCHFSLADPDAGLAAWEARHIPGARYAHLNLDLSGPRTPHTGRHPLPDPQVLAARLGAWGIDDRCQVVVYDEVGGAMAVRLWWLLRWSGHTAVAVLDGGLAGWLAAGGAVVAQIPQIQPRQFIPRADAGVWVDAARVAAELARGGVLLDARAVARFRGDIEPFDPVAGHVPGARSLPLEGNLDSQGRFLPAMALRQRFDAALGAGFDAARVMHMCGSGVTACHNLLAMEHAGLSGSRLYVGSWSDWITDARRPVARGAE